MMIVPYAFYGCYETRASSDVGDTGETYLQFDTQLQREIIIKQLPDYIVHELLSSLKWSYELK